MSTWNRIVAPLIFVGIVVGAIYRFAFAFTPFWLDIVIVSFLSGVLALIGLIAIVKPAIKSMNTPDA